MTIQVSKITNEHPYYSKVILMISNDDMKLGQLILDYLEAKEKYERLKDKLVEELELN